MSFVAVTADGSCEQLMSVMTVGTSEVVAAEGASTANNLLVRPLVDCAKDDRFLGEHHSLIEERPAMAVDRFGKDRVVVATGHGSSNDLLVDRRDKAIFKAARDTSSEHTSTDWSKERLPFVEATG